MKHLLRLWALSVLVATTAAAQKDADGYVGPNGLRSSSAVTTYRDNGNGVPSYVEGTLSSPVKAADQVAASMQFFEEHRGAYRMANPADELVLKRIDRDDLGMSHVRFTQQHLGLRVIGGDLITHFDARGTLRTVNGNYVPDIDLDVTTKYSVAEATEIARTDLKSFFGEASPDTPELVVFPWEGSTYLAWRMFLMSDTPMGRWEYFVDATTGEVVYKANRIMDAEETAAIGTGVGVMGDTLIHVDTDFDGSTYRMLDYTRRANNDIHGHGGQMPPSGYIQTNVAGSSLPGTLATDADNFWNDPNTQSPAVSGHVYTSLVYDYLLSHFGRNGYNGAGASMLTIVNYSGDGDDNAYWDGSRIVVWSWSSGWRSLAGCPDVIAHEWGHAVTEYCSDLVYEKEAGALNESFSDMIGAAFEFAHDSMDVPDWLMGENGRTTGAGFRDMANPHAAGDPDTYGTGDPYWVDVVNCSPSWLNDYCGVHTNSGVGNKWYYLLSDGGVHNGQSVTGIGPQNAILVAYRANAFYWTSTTTYHEAALATITAANDLDPTGDWAQSVANAWEAVNVDVPGPEIYFQYPAGLPSIVPPGEPTTFDVTIGSLLGGTPVPGSGQLHYSIDGAPFTAVPMTEISSTQYEATLPSAACNSLIAYYVSAQETTSGTYYDPDPSAPAQAIVALSETVTFADNFQTDLGWTVAGDASGGQWGRAVPNGGGDRGDPPTDYDGSGACYLTGPGDGDTDVDGGTTRLYSPTIDLSAGDGRISYARWYSNNFGADPNNDLMYVYISNDNGTNWTLVESIGPSVQAGGGWNVHSFFASEFVTPTATMKVRFDAGDLNSGSVIEAAVDAFSVTIYECDLATPSIVTTSIPDWTEGGYMEEQLQSTGGTGSHTWSDKFGDLSGTGLSLSSTGLLSGTPLAAGEISFTAEVTDESAQTDEQAYSFTINQPMTITSTTLPEWTAGQAYNQSLTVSGGTGVKTWSDINGDLAGTGLTVNANGTVTGTPVSAQVINFTAAVSDNGGGSAQQPVSVTINPMVSIVTASLDNARQGSAYSSQLEGTGGTGVKTWADINSDLVGTGLSLTTDGLLSGTPGDTGVIEFMVRYRDEAGSQAFQVLLLTVDPPYICGDVNNDQIGPDLADLIYLVNYLFSGGEAPTYPGAADATGEGEVDLSDLIYLVNYLFEGGPVPTCGS
ncbi:MAG: M4 family metallopeptidase [candidate division Zixibacteria bacterium]|jgi:thermolysin|nr:M4 family metallopeptidase [candidate division Zixibacteria bacterium]